MSLADIVEKVKSGVVHIVHTVDGTRQASGTGFMVEGYLVTNYHVAYSPPKESVVVLRTIYDDPDSFMGEIQMTNSDFLNKTETASDENNYDYVVFNIPELSQQNLYNFKLSNYKQLKKRIGDKIFFLGYSFDKTNLACNSGIISSFYKSKSIDVIQIDASVNHSNSGSPLIDPESSEVIGIITKKATGLNKTFEIFRSILNENIEMLSANKNLGIVLGNFELTQGILAGQNQMLEMTDYLERSANVGIGYAFSVESLMNENFYFENNQG